MRETRARRAADDGRRPRSRRSRLRRALRATVGGVGGLLLFSVLVSVYGCWRAPAVGLSAARDPRPLVVDVTRLSRVPMAQVVAPRTLAELAAAVRSHPGPISVGGGRYSMGGQTATPGGLQIDMRAYHGVIALDSVAKTVTVRAGSTWREVQETVDRAGLAVKIMQTYNSFTVGGTLSVNAHGRYVGLGPVVGSVREIVLVLADGSVVRASRTERPELFHGAIGGYGAIGVIAEATLDLADNVRVRRTDVRMPIGEYARWFRAQVRANPRAVFHNADIYPDAYDRVNAVTYAATDDPVTDTARIRPPEQGSAFKRGAVGAITGLPGGRWVREHALDPVLFAGEPVTWRNYEASYDVSELEPASRDRSTYVLQEFFVPVDSFDAFVPRLRRVLREHEVNALNVSIRHATADTATMLAWAPTEVFAFVLYYRQGTDPASRRAVGAWTRALADAALASGGRWYLPYQPHATRAQFARAYPRAAELLALKRAVDPTGKFTNGLWDVYAPAADGSTPPVTAARLPAVLPAEARLALDSLPAYARSEGAALLTHPEWDLVYGSESYAAWLRAGRRPSGFPYAASVGTFWRSYVATWRAARARYAVDAGTHVMLNVIGLSTAAEYGLKGAYENTVGRLSELAMPAGGTAEDRYAARVAEDYCDLIRRRGWYEFDFGAALGGLWRDVPLAGPGMVRKWERRLALSAEYAVKAGYAALIGAGTATAYSPDADLRHLVVAGWPATTASPAPDSALARLRAVRTLDRRYTVLAVERYVPFRDALLALSERADAVRIAEIGGNERITITGTAPRDWSAPAATRPVVAYAVPADPQRVRVLLELDVRDLLDVLAAVRAEGRMVVDHVYDY